MSAIESVKDVWRAEKRERGTSGGEGSHGRLTASLSSQDTREAAHSWGELFGAAVGQ